MRQIQFDLEDRLLEYAARIIRSGTSPLPNHGEAQAAESRDDFIHKMSVCLKELRESRQWIRLIQRVPMLKSPRLLDALLEETESLIKIFDASIRTAKRNAK